MEYGLSDPKPIHIAEYYVNDNDNTQYNGDCYCKHLYNRIKRIALLNGFCDNWYLGWWSIISIY